MTNDSAADAPLLSPTYASARRDFLDAAERVGASVESAAHPFAGREGEPLAIDVATIGPDDATSVLVIVSGTHGVEGYAGSALQKWWLDERASMLDPGVRAVLIHALNPFGFSWVRRVNEDNVDLNRNFVDWSEAPPANEAYGEIADLLVPADWNETTVEETTGKLFALAGEAGLERFQEIVSSGQYDHPIGIFHGGRAPSWSHRWLAAQLPALVGPATRLGLIDLHTGLGPWGHGELISHESAGDPGHETASSWWRDVRSMTDGDSVSANLNGDWLAAIEKWVPDVEVTAATLEFGTVDTITVLQSLRADAWLHAHGDPTSDDAAAIRAQVRAAFADDDPSAHDDHRSVRRGVGRCRSVTRRTSVTVVGVPCEVGSADSS